MSDQPRCANAMCSCPASPGQIYCGEYCAQAVAQGIERDYCQCEHEHAAPMFSPSFVSNFSREAPEVTALQLHAVR